ncbi:MAG: hypothetical protein JSU66_11095 [Deltaproteobacteria bacterium]|nr:MAG: hypothetical protein JSU66_11095 [Deltaproteobacteria bacterium]
MPTPLGEIVNPDGCSIWDLAPREHALSGAVWKSHGVSVKNLTHTARDFLDAGLLSEAEKAAVVSSGAATDCGEK